MSASGSGGVHLLADTPSKADGHCSGRYASYWNAFLSLERLGGPLDEIVTVSVHKYGVTMPRCNIALNSI